MPMPNSSHFQVAGNARKSRTNYPEVVSPPGSGRNWDVARAFSFTLLTTSYLATAQGKAHF